MTRLVRAWLSIGFLVGGLAVWAQAGAVTDGLRVGQRPPAFSAMDLRGEVHSLKQHRGKIIVLHFWATWCPYCRGEIPKLLQVHRELSSKGVTVLAVSVDDDLSKLRQFVAAAALPYTVIPEVQLSVPLTETFRVRGLPTTYFVARDGLVADRVVGASDLLGEVRRLLEQSPEPPT